MLLRLPLSFLRPTLVFSLPLLGGCPPTDPPCAGTVVGSVSATPALVPMALTLAGNVTPLRDGDSIDLTRPIQGGHVLFAGAYVRNVDGCSGSFLGELLRVDPADPKKPGSILVYEERSTDLTSAPLGELAALPVAEADKVPGSWGRPAVDPGLLANVPSCPNVQEVDAVDAPLFLRMSYIEKGGRKTSASVRVVPRCRQSNQTERDLCKCECQARYTIDRCLM